MNTLIVEPKNQKDLELLKIVLEKMRFQYKELTEEQKEDIGLLRAMAETHSEERVPLSRVKEYLDK